MFCYEIFPEHTYDQTLSAIGKITQLLIYYRRWEGTTAKEVFLWKFLRQSVIFVNAQKPIVDYDVGDEKAVQLGQPKAMAQDPQ